MKLLDSSKIHPDPSTLWGKACELFINHINFCHDYYDGPIRSMTFSGSTGSSRLSRQNARAVTRCGV